MGTMPETADTNVSPPTVGQDREQGRRTPSDAALKLLLVAEKHPEVLMEVQIPIQLDIGLEKIESAS